MMSVTEATMTASSHWKSPASERPFGLGWGLAFLFAELLFIWCRASAQRGASIDDLEIWIVGAGPFALCFLFQRIFLWPATRYLEVWMASLTIFLIVQIFDVAHFIEYPLYLRIDVGVGRYLAAATVYAAMGLLLVIVMSLLMKSRRPIDIAELPPATALAICSLAFGLFQPY